LTPLLRYFRLLIGIGATLTLKLNHLKEKIITQEGQCLTKTLLFEVKTMSNENLWYKPFLDVELWDIVESKYTIHVKINLNGEVITILICEWDDKQKIRHSYNTKTINAFFYALKHGIF
jgi:hypothetical protein